MFPTNLLKNISKVQWLNITHRNIKSTLNTHNVKNSLIDNFGRKHNYLRISLTERCNLRCQYCMPAKGVNLTEKNNLLTTDEIITLSKIFINQGITKIRLTGGEPTIRKDLNKIIENLKSIPKLENVAITTNGLVLTKQLVELQKAGLDSINISLDTLNSMKYEQLTRRKGLQRVLIGIDLALQLGYNPVKINCVVMKNFNDNEIINFVNLTKDKNLDVRFIEYMPFDGNQWQFNKMVPYIEILKIIKQEFPNIYSLENSFNDTSKSWKIPNYKGQIGFITSMSEHFCNGCNRLRITADGNLKVCLFGNNEISLRDALRSGHKDNLIKIIESAVKRKKKQHAGMMNLVEMKNRPMIFIDKLKNLISPPVLKSTINKRMFSSNSVSLTHLNKNGKVKMVDVTEKPKSKRVAIAQATIIINRKLTELIEKNLLKKGDVLTIAKIAGIMGAKRTCDIIPLCHNIKLTEINVNINLIEAKNEILINAKITSFGKTGVEMEALTAVSVAALTIYDMCKSISHEIKITNIHLIKKSGGTGGDYEKDNIKIRNYDDSPIINQAVHVGNL